ncbi:MAG: hypothetical protein ABIH37_01250 [archaeon]
MADIGSVAESREMTPQSLESRGFRKLEAPSWIHDISRSVRRRSYLCG